VVAGGIANMVYVIPSQALFGKRVPPGMMGRVVSIRSAMVGVAYLTGIAAAGLLGAKLGIGPVLLGAGAFTLAVGTIGGFFRQVRLAD
jgi:hypothetical protein